MTAAEIARKRLEACLEAKVGQENDLTEWVCYTWLQKQLERYKVDRSGFGSFEYQDDHATALKNVLAWKEARREKH
jgi:hypothetical protein